MRQHMAILGFEVRDAVTGFSGVATSVSFDLYGCIQVVVTPKANEKGETADGRWFDLKRLVKTGSKPVLEVPDFCEIKAGKQIGGFDKPKPSSNPIR